MLILVLPEKEKRVVLLARMIEVKADVADTGANVNITMVNFSEMSS